MGFLSLFMVASMPILQVLIIGLLGAFLASGYSNVLSFDARKHMNKVVFIAFTPALMFASLAKTVTLQDILSWWFMPVNILMIYLIGGLLGWIAVKITKPERYLEGLVIASCTAGNFGNLMIMIIPAVCDEDGSPFGDQSICRTDALSYASFSMALGGFFIWTHSYSLMKKSGEIYRKIRLAQDGIPKIPNKDSDANGETSLLKTEGEVAYYDQEATTTQINVQYLSSGKLSGIIVPFWEKLKGTLYQVGEELLAPPTAAAVIGLIFGATPWLKSLIIGSDAPLRVIQDSVKLLGDGTIPSVTLILGGDLTQGLRNSRLKLSVILAVICVKFVLLPLAGIAVVKVAGDFGFLAPDPLFHYVLMTQFTVSPAVNLGTMAQLFDVAQEECSVLFLWTYLVAAIAITVWSTIFMWILA